MITRPKIVLLGMLTKMPVGGVAWLVGQYIIGFERLGFEVYYVEAHARTPSMFVRDEHDDGTDEAAAYLSRVMNRFGLAGRWALQALHADGRCVGMTSSHLARVYRDAALIINMHGGTVPLPEHSATGRLVLLSTDPVELELEIDRGLQRALDFLEPHVAAFTWGLNYGNPDCRLPWADKYRFVPSPPPIVLDLWATTAPPPDAPFTTIGNWRQDWREVDFEGERYGWSKHREFLKVVDLPERVTGSLELALSSATDADRAMLRDHGWRVEDGLAVSADMDDYRDYLARSRAEFTVAKDQNVRFRSGWFSERSACYLASGRPVVMQDTGFGNALATGEGLLAFTDIDSAASAVDAVMADGERHRRGARDVAASFLSYDVVLPAMLAHLGVAVNRRAAAPASGRLRAGPALPSDLSLVPVSRRPLVLPAGTERAVLDRPVPVTSDVCESPRVSIVMVVLDNVALTRMAAESALATTDGDVELVIIDNGSGVDAARYLSVLAARNTRVRLIRNEDNRGFAPAINQGLAVARGDVLVLLNNDVVTPPGWLDGLVRHLRDPAIGLVGPATNRCGNEAEIPTSYATHGGLLTFVEERRASTDAQRVTSMFDIPVATMFCVAMRRDTLDAVGLLDAQFEIGLFEDDDYSRRVRDAGYRVVCATDVFVHHFGEGSLGKLAADGRYGAVFAANRSRYEQKWKEEWRGHGRTPDPAYAAMIARVHAALLHSVPAGATTLVVSRGDEQLVPVGQDRLCHFPQLEGGGYCGHHPADDVEAIDRLERLRRGGAQYLVVPKTSLWWLDHYSGFAAHLSSRYPTVLDEPETAVIYSLCPADSSEGTAPDDPDHANQLVAELMAERDELRRQLHEAERATVERLMAQMSSRIDGLEDLLDDVIHPQPAEADPVARACRECVRRHVRRGAAVVVVGSAGSDPVDVAGRPTSLFVADAGDACDSRSGVEDLGGARSSGAIARLEAMRAEGAEFLLVPTPFVAWFARHRRFADHVVGLYQAVSTDGELLLFDLRERRASSQALSAVLGRTARMLDTDLAILDWTALDLATELGPFNVFSAPTTRTLPYLDRSVDVVLIDDVSRAREATRIAAAAVITVSAARRPLSAGVAAVDEVVHSTLTAQISLRAVCTSRSPSARWRARLTEAFGDVEVIGVATSADVWPGDDGDLIAIVDDGVLPLPGCIEAARLTLARSGVGAVAVKLIGADGTLDAAGVTVFAEGSSCGIAHGATDVAAPWHDFVRDTCAGAGLLFVNRSALAAVRCDLADPPTDLVGWAGAIWAAGFRVVYQPEAEAVRIRGSAVSTSTAPTPGGVTRRLSRHRPKPSSGPMSGPSAEPFWRDVLATDEPSSCWQAAVEVVS